MVYYKLKGTCFFSKKKCQISEPKRLPYVTSELFMETDRTGPKTLSLAKKTNKQKKNNQTAWRSPFFISCLRLSRLQEDNEAISKKFKKSHQIYCPKMFSIAKML